MEAKHPENEKIIGKELNEIMTTKIKDALSDFK